MLRPGTNPLECMPRGADGFTWCYNKVSAPAARLRRQARAQGADDKAIQLAVEEATKAGTLKPTPFGTMSYRLYGKRDRIQLLWVLSVPGATPDTDRRDDGERA